MVFAYVKGLKLGGEKKLYEKPEFKPDYLHPPGLQYAAINAMIEIRELWNYVVKDAFHDYSYMYARLECPLTNELIVACKDHKESFAVYDKKRKEWPVKPSEPPYTFCYDGKDFIHFDVAKNITEGYRLLLVGKFTRMMQEPNLVMATKDASMYFRDFTMPSIKLTVGVPGCGKTRHIIKNHVTGSLVLTSCKEAAEDIRTRMSKLKGGKPSDYSRSYRTIDSYLINRRITDTYSSVWIDEALMEHPGKLFLVCLFSHCRELCLLGDPNQLGYINRTDAKLLLHKSSTFFKPSKTLNISHRCPADVMAILSRHYDYDGGAYTATNVLRSLECKKFTDLENVPNLVNTKYLVFKQAEKKQMKAQGYDVSTVHEYQGKEAARVVLVKMSHNTQPSQCESDSHLLVAMSRHRESLVYYTPVKDKLRKLLETGFTDDELKAHQKLPLSPYVTYVIEIGIFIYLYLYFHVSRFIRFIVIWFQVDDSYVDID